MTATKLKKIGWWDPTVAQNSYSPATAMLLNHAMANEKTLHVGTCHGRVDAEGMPDFHKKLLEVTGGLTVVNCRPIEGQGPAEVMIVWPTGSILTKHRADHSTDVEFSTTNLRLYSRLAKVCQAYMYIGIPTVYFLARDAAGQIKATPGGPSGVAFEPDNYEQDVQQYYDFMVKEVQSKTPNGRLTVIQGLPGGGKTHLVSALIQEVCETQGDSVRFLFVPPALIQDLSGPSLMQALMEARANLKPEDPMILIVEDADQCLKSREESLSSISAVLNSADGILGAALNLHLICTTNVKVENLDGALGRSGRLSQVLEVGALSPERISKVIQRLCGRVFPPETFEGRPEAERTLSGAYAMARRFGKV